MEEAVPGSFDATRAFSEATQFNMAKETHSKEYADTMVKQLEIFVKDKAAAGALTCTWTIPETEERDFDLVITQRAVRHYLRSGEFYWSQGRDGRTYTVKWTATEWSDYLRRNNFDLRNCPVM